MRKKMILLRCLLSILSFGFFVFAENKTEMKKGAISGNVLDLATQSNLPGVHILVKGRDLAAFSDEKGNFVISDVPVGSYSLEFSLADFATLVKTDIIVRSSRNTFVKTELQFLIKEEVSVTAPVDYFYQGKEQPTSSMNYSFEEIRRNAGSAGDVSRIMMSLPSVAKVNDGTNALAVRGGSPAENSFYIDNIEIPNINHYPNRGASGGRIGILNVDFIQDVNFYAGGFSSVYGDKMSSVMDINFREGSRKEFDMQFDLSMAGFGLVAEGPFKDKGSWMISARKSYLDLINDAIGVGVAPNYGDLQGKLTLDTSSSSQLMLLSISGIDRIGWNKEEARDMDTDVYGDNETFENTIGLNWRKTWKGNGYSNTSISYSYTRYKGVFYDINSDVPNYDDVSSEHIINLRNVNFFRINEKNQIRLGLEAKHVISGYQYFLNESIDFFGNKIPAVSKDIKVSADKAGLFFNYTWNPHSGFTVNLGTRLDYFSFNNNYHLSPRISLSYRFSAQTSLNVSGGAYHQNLPLILLFQNEKNKELKDPVSYHYVFGISHLLKENTRLSVEAYYKEYDHLPLDPQQPSLFIVDELFYREGYSDHSAIVDTGKARSYGIELTLQKKLKSKFYGLLGASYSKTRYQDFNGIWRNRVHDNRYIFSVEGGYKPDKNWEFSLRWIFAGGTPYTPFDIEASTAVNSGIFDVNKINEVRSPDYHSLNVRLDKRFNFKNSNLVIYLMVWNVYNRKNIAFHFWNKFENKPDVEYQWSTIPVLGFEFEF